MDPIDVDLSKQFTPRDPMLFNKCDTLVKFFLNLDSKISFKNLEDNFIRIHFNTILWDDKETFLKELDQVPQLKPFFEKIIVDIQELVEIVNQNEEINQINRVFGTEELQNLNSEYIYFFVQNLYERIIENSREKYGVHTSYYYFIVYEFLIYYKNLEGNLFSSKHNYKLLFEFQNLKISEGFTLKLNNYLTIRSINEEEYFFVNSRRQTHFMYRSGNITNPILAVTFTVKKNEGYSMKSRSPQRKGTFSFDNEFIDEIIFDALTCLRLSNINYVGFKRLFQISAGPLPNCMEYFFPYLYSLPYFNENQKNFQFDESNAENLLKIYNKYCSAKKDEKLLLSLSRFNTFYERHRPEDKLIDTCIGLEVLLEVNNGRSGKDKIIKKLKKLLVPNYCSVNDIKAVDPIIELRNDIVHSRKKHSIEKIGSEANYLHEILKKVINRYLENAFT